MAELVKFTTDVKTYTQPGKIERSENAIGFHLINTGSVIVYVNNFPIYPSGVFDTMYSGYSDQSQYTIRFDTTVIPIPNPELTVITFNRIK
jgi:hypothetical protein